MAWDGVSEDKKALCSSEWKHRLGKTLSLRFNGHFPTWTYVSWYQNVSILDFIGARMMDVVVTIGAITHAKLRSNRHHQHPDFYRPDAFPVTQPTASKHFREKISHSTDLFNQC